MNIAICDDENVIIEELSQMTRDYFADIGIDAVIHSFTDAESLLSASTEYDILLLDCKLPGVDGVELARRIKAKSPASEIVFITAYADYIFDSYDVEHLKYIIKPVTREQIKKTYDDYFSHLNERRPVFVMTDLSIPMSDIYYITSHKSHSAVRTGQTVYNSTKSLRDLESELNPDAFMCVTRGIIIGFAHIERYKDGHVIMEDKAGFDVSRRKKNEFIKRYTRYLNSHR